MWENKDFANYIVGQADADSCFYLCVRSCPTCRFGIRVSPEWGIVKAHDGEILSKIRDFLGVGKIYLKKYTHSDLVGGNLRVVDLDCAKIVEFFEKFPLKANKRKDFEIWKKAVAKLVARKGYSKRDRPWTKRELIEMLELAKQISELPHRIKRRKRKVAQRDALLSRLKASI